MIRAMAVVSLLEEQHTNVVLKVTAIRTEDRPKSRHRFGGRQL